MRVSHHKPQIIALCLLTIVLGIVPSLLSQYEHINSVQTLNWIGDGFLFLAMIASWNFFNGSLGKIDLGHTTYLGIGAYATAIASIQLQIPFVFCVLIGIISSILYALCVGFVILRLRGVYFAVASLALLIGTRVLVIGLRVLTNGGIGLTVSLPYDAGIFYTLTLILLATIILAIGFIQATAYRGILLAIRHDDMLASVRGIPVMRYQLLSYCISAAFMGIIGGIWLYRHPTLDPNSVFIESHNFELVSAALIGGYGSIIGSLIGGILNYVLLSPLSNEWQLITTSVVLILCIRYLPGGIVTLWRSSKTKFDWFSHENLSSLIRNENANE